MSAVEEIQQAIATLERLRAASTRGDWQSGEHDPGGGFSYIVARSRYVTAGANFVESADLHTGDADLIVTLHRTIDAQLEIMRRDIDKFASYEEATGIKPSEYAEGPGSWLTDQSSLVLARAINGAAS